MAQAQTVRSYVYIHIAWNLHKDDPNTRRELWIYKHIMKYKRKS